jgi:flagellar basal-body rod modification protein FlgD
MPTVPNPAPSTQYTPPETEQSTTPRGGLGKDDFLKLFVAQLQHQDPMNPMSDMDFIGQMASFSTLEQVSNMAAENARVADSLASSNAIGLIGRTVTWTDENDQTHTGVVEKVTTAGGVPSLTVSGTDGVTLSTISQVA